MDEQTVELNGIKVTKAQLEAGLAELKQRESNPIPGDVVNFRSYNGNNTKYLVIDFYSISLDTVRKNGGKMLVCLADGSLTWDYKFTPDTGYTNLGPFKGIY